MKKYSALLKQLPLFLFFIHASISNAQTVTPVVKANLPSILNESSGLEVINRNSFWSHNDGGGNAELYHFDSSGVLLNTLTIVNAANVDWEDIARDSTGNIYIGDFGNNNNNRQDLKIYIIPDPAVIPGDSILPQLINFSYPDQTAFPPTDPYKNFDCEAMIAYHDSIYLFSKDQSNPYSGYTKLYRLPQTPGTYIANLLDSFYTGPGPVIAYSITSADITADGSRLALLGYNRIWIFSAFTGSHFFSGTVQQFTIPTLTQKEGICFLNNTELYLTDESAFGTGQKLYYLDLSPFLTGLHHLQIKNDIEVSISPNPFTEKTTISLLTEVPGNYGIYIYSEEGKALFFNHFFLGGNKKKNILITAGQINNYKGVLIVEIKDGKNKKVAERKFLRL